MVYGSPKTGFNGVFVETDDNEAVVSIVDGLHLYLYMLLFGDE
ncbi:hypothetical protein RchiOBHm_Chr5g0069701 [Rosa chinensis]|uniref:Uncharacterized protein n=1 Tax=Rosa chinensis TaxID=74649 RepID=A0A2P6QK17_ROSCH|nr:hypothetical protein RchiOBHm_Chr5g0069701 [Rosa chinensis]